MLRVIKPPPIAHAGEFFSSSYCDIQQYHHSADGALLIFLIQPKNLAELVS